MAQMRPRPAVTNLGRVRQEVGLSQIDLAKLSGVSIATLRRIERGEVTSPSIRHLANLALVLDVELNEICEPEWIGWSRLPGTLAKPPSRELIRQLREGQLKLED